MTELERWMDDHPPLADALTAEETAALRQKVLARRPELHALRGWRVMAAAAALCLVAAGAVVLGLFHPMSAANEANKLVQKYGVVLDEPLTAEINGHTVTVRALLRGQNTLRVLYDVDHAQGLEPWDLVWSTANFTFIPTEESAHDKRMYTVTNFGTGLCGGYAVGSFETRNATSESGILSCFVDIPLHSNPAKMRTLWIGDLNNYDAKASLKVELPDAAQPITIAADTSIAMKGGPWFHYDLTDEEREAFPDGTFNITAIRIEPLAVSIVGGDYESEPQNLSRYNVQGRVKLYRADGSEITYGWDGNFFQGQYSPTVLRVDSYDIIDPEAVAYVEIDGERFDVKQ